MKKELQSILVVLILFLGSNLAAQTSYKVHSHNDYAQELPFWFAYANGAASIEADVFLKDNTLYVTHTEAEIVEGRTFQTLYLDRLQKLQESGNLKDVQVLIDFKSEAYATLERLVEVLEDYPQLLKADKVRFVISGNRPKPADYGKYPNFIWFDHQNLDELDRIELNKVALVSTSFKNYSVWNGYGRMTAPDLKTVEAAINKAKSVGKPFRFWASPDTKTAWARLARLGVDYINTDQPALAQQYLTSLEANTYTRETPIPVYQPKYGYAMEAKPTNVILMIGDGNGLAQITAAMVANQGSLTLTEIKDIGLVKTASHDDLITDSAAGATAMATGVKTNNRAIGVDADGNGLANLVDAVSAKGFNTAIVTTDAIYGATPSSFFAHSVERDDTEGLVADLNSSGLDLFISGGQNQEDSIQNKFKTQSLESFETLQGPTAIYLGNHKVPSISSDRGSIFPEAVKKSLEALRAKEQPFFLMVEGAQIDNGGHSNSVGDIVEELLDFDRAIAEALEFADTHGNTLVVITADHETSGFGIVGGNMKEGRVQGDFLTVDHTGIMVPLFSYGPQSQNFRGVYENTDIHHKILGALGIAAENGK
ncbi:alkaline phosphatase [Flagellimonas olearia]|uniref:Alkaline phosphatase n=1 Tax=Flagellimonas olearia TaxID=552546 RepID=A0A6I1DXF7_9FLAO|nr:alkaline phosphatase [Allomuricauda olearia]KAB7530163.1 alkaline phosphatase [Allomuricauda olearia]